jgi:hypothetical protein
MASIVVGRILDQIKEKLKCIAASTAASFHKYRVLRRLVLYIRTPIVYYFPINLKVRMGA